MKNDRPDIVTRLISAAIAVDNMPISDLEALLAEAAVTIQTLRRAVTARQTEAATLH